MSNRKVEEMAEEHAEWFAESMKQIVKIAAKTMFIHGHKHGKEEAEK